eukprot:TRINITY_DN110787_c0_g1_i1.p1 TRINITY_DN110787_c0_g1~~TRINITY_DN110787_c0_g1_i1.p1  ORF type:complete len:167 (+),score=28.99 TRINITY_DN110787_c0_g1_i1:44-544(+)
MELRGAAAVTPSLRESTILHLRVWRWMKRTRYAPQDSEEKMLASFRKSAQSMALGTFSLTYLVSRQLVPGTICARQCPIPWAIFPTAAMFFFLKPVLDLRLPSFYTQVLQLPTPMGQKARHELDSLRKPRPGAVHPSADAFKSPVEAKATTWAEIRRLNGVHVNSE